jgi:hypothetical protein
MGNKSIILALCISLAFNIGFIIICAYFLSQKPQTIMQSPPKHQRMHSTMLSDEMREMRRDNIQLRRAFFAELAKPEVNYTIVNEMALDLEDSQRMLEHSVLHHFIYIRTQMPAEEASDVFGSFQRRYDRNRDREKTRDREMSGDHERKPDKSKKGFHKGEKT